MLFRIILNNIKTQTFSDFFHRYRLNSLKSSVLKLNFCKELKIATGFGQKEILLTVWAKLV